MDKHIEMSYCGFEAFKVLAKNYLNLDSHDLFNQISKLLGEVNVTPADVAENLMPKKIGEDPTLRLEVLIEALKKAKENPASKTEGAETKDGDHKASCLWLWNYPMG
ncbi:AAA-ATPase-like protein [Drosera capensis]